MTAQKDVGRPHNAKTRYPDPRPCDGLGSGEWVLVHGVRKWVSHECPDCGGELRPGDRCETCLTWAVKNARDTEWARMSWANRHVIWDVLALRKERELMAS